MIGKRSDETHRYLNFFRHYLMYKQKYNIEIPASVCGQDGDFELVSAKLKDLFLLERNYGKCHISKHTYYKVLKEQNYSAYEAWCTEESSEIKKQWHSLNDFLELYEGIKRDGYQLSKSIIVIDNENVVLDGWHRAAILLHLYGEEYEIKVIKMIPEHRGKDRNSLDTPFERIFSVKSDTYKKHKVITILGIKIKFKRRGK